MARRIGKKGRAKVRLELHKFKHGTLRSTSKRGPKVRSRKQAIAIALSEGRRVSRMPRRGK